MTTNKRGAYVDESPKELTPEYWEKLKTMTIVRKEVKPPGVFCELSVQMVIPTTKGDKQ